MLFGASPVAAGREDGLDGAGSGLSAGRSRSSNQLRRLPSIFLNGRSSSSASSGRPASRSSPSEKNFRSRSGAMIQRSTFWTALPPWPCPEESGAARAAPRSRSGWPVSGTFQFRLVAAGPVDRAFALSGMTSSGMPPQYSNIRTRVVAAASGECAPAGRPRRRDDGRKRAAWRSDCWRLETPDPRGSRGKGRPRTGSGECSRSNGSKSAASLTSSQHDRNGDLGRNRLAAELRGREPVSARRAERRLVQLPVSGTPCDCCLTTRPDSSTRRHSLDRRRGATNQQNEAAETRSPNL